LNTIAKALSIADFGKSSFSYGNSFSSISFESESKLQRIEEYVFSYSGLKTIVIPNGIRFIDDSAFVGCSLESLSISPGVSDFCAFGSFLADRSHCLIV
jgi:hypothetical protein